jgi:hypothetical protein
MSDIVFIGNHWPAEMHYSRRGWHHCLTKEGAISAFRNRARVSSDDLHHGKSLEEQLSTMGISLTVAACAPYERLAGPCTTNP